jgi:hypothetical protein
LTPLEIAQGQLDAYNIQDLDAHVAYFADDVVIADFNGAVSLTGRVAYRERYAKVFGDFPQNKVELVNRMVLGGTVIDHERVRRTPDAEPFDVIAIYTIAGGKIARVDFARA